MNAADTVLDDSSSDSETDSQDTYLAAQHPKFELSEHRKFEISELCTIFLHKYVSYVYMFLLCLIGFLCNWSYATVAGSAWATNIPFHDLGRVEMCEGNSFLHRIIPEPDCLYAYYFSLAIFTVIIVPLCLCDLTEQAVIHIVLGLMRFAAILGIIVYCIVNLSLHGDACQDQPLTNDTTRLNITLSSFVFNFDARGWLVAIPVIANGFMVQISISSLTFPLNKKRYHHWLLACVVAVALGSYVSLGVLVSMWFRAATQETCTLGWVSTCMG